MHTIYIYRVQQTYTYAFLLFIKHLKMSHMLLIHCTVWGEDRMEGMKDCEGPVSSGVSYSGPNKLHKNRFIPN